MANSVDIEVLNKTLVSVAEEMGIVLQRSAFSSNIKERRDFSCAIFDSSGQLLAQAAHIPVHLGAMPDTVAEIRKRFVLSPGDIIITNDPFAGGTHLPDITLISGVFSKTHGRLLFYLVARAHHADVGAKVPGSMALAMRLEDEGIVITPTYFSKNGEILEEYLHALVSKMRNQGERAGDLRAQVACLLRGEERLHEVLARYGENSLFELLPHLISYGNRFMENTIEKIPDGSYRFEDFLDDDGINSDPVPIRVRIDVAGKKAIVDFDGTASQVATSLNATKSVTRSAVFYCFFCLVGEGYPVNSGSLAPVEIRIPEGCLLNPRPPAPVAAGNVETSQRVVDTVLGALSVALPDVIPAASCGSMNNLSIGGTAEGKEFTYYETIGGGMGARPGRDGLSGVQVHMTNTLNTPIEALEQAYPLMVEQYSLRRGSGGQGRFRGGDGIVRRYRFRSQCKFSLLTERRRLAPWGLNMGGSGQKGENILFRKGRNEGEMLPGKCVMDAFSGDVLEIRTPGGGGWGGFES